MLSFLFIGIYYKYSRNKEIGDSAIIASWQILLSSRFLWKYEIRHLVIDYGVTIEERTTRYKHAKAYYITILRNRQDVKSYIIRISILLFIRILL